MGRVTGRGFGVLLALGLGTAQAAEAPEWDTVSKGGVTVRTRPRADIPDGQEIWAEGDMDVGLTSLETLLKAHEQMRRWMPRVKESRVVSEEGVDSRVTYTQLELPVIANRDFVSRVVETRGQDERGRATLQQHWVPAKDVLPERRGVVRLRHNAGSWSFTAREEGGVHYVYRFVTEPGGSIPGFLAGVGQTDAVLETVRAVERRARQLEKDAPAR